MSNSLLDSQAIESQTREASLLRSVFLWMTGGLLLTALVAQGLMSSEGLLQTVMQPSVMFTALIVEVILVIALAALLPRLSAGTCTLLFLGYSALNGITLTPLALTYTGESIALAFGLTGGTFGVMALYGYTTKRNLSGLGPFLFMALIGIIIAMIVNLFVGGTALAFWISAGAVVVFTLLTAYDVQRIKELAQDFSDSDDARHKVAIMGALTLYLDFINLLVHLLRLVGERRSD